eukprot:CAMPEP_0197286688 /NCGR_PEP_ID=MMETSP0890-20130614/2267_1 /TAXON_ID=44058 ORGANISM="Aureoumbra lagunensis, Strain CCMP1510" /NCGR_SAMPLE_ID=MMETSP0890 /ASSEMBLY_ACC=CAM_ASM_000533 /LENGTH=135 /DNA_ID=CAMNT_0042755305 /DNA_START=58 /DNA_END=465 /DNA_ORIENTATION=-
MVMLGFIARSAALRCGSVNVRCGARGAAFASKMCAPLSSISSNLDGDNRKTGTVKWFSTEKGFGFIVPAAGGDDLFVHQTQIHAQGFRSLAEGETVEFDEETDSSGRKRAIGVTGPDGDYVQGAPRNEQRYDDFY